MVCFLVRVYNMLSMLNQHVLVQQHSCPLYLLAAQSNATQVEIKQATSTNNITLEEGQHTEINVSRQDYLAIHATQPVLVVHYLMTSPENALSLSQHHKPCNSYMLIVPSVEHEADSYMISSTGALSNQSLNIMVLSALRNGLLLNGEPISDDHIMKQSEVEGHKGSYTALKVYLPDGVHNMTHESKGTFRATSHGQAYSLPEVDIVTKLHTEHMPSYTVANPLRTTLVPTDNPDYEHKDTAAVPTGGSESTHRHKVLTLDKSKHENEVLEKMEVIRVKSDKILNEAVRSRHTAVISETGTISPAVLAVLISLAAAVAAVVVCILGFLVAELPCRRGEYFRGARVVPLSD